MTGGTGLLSAANGCGRVSGGAAALILTCAMAVTLPGCGRTESEDQGRGFPDPRSAVLELDRVVKAGDASEMMVIFGPAAKVLVDSSDAVTARRNQQVFSAAVAERWHLEDAGPDRKTLVIGFEEWPFPIPLARDKGVWRFDTTAGAEEVLARRIGRNELAVIRLCQTYIGAQRRYAKYGHGGKRAGIYAATFGSDPGRENGLYWEARHGQRRSPLGELLAAAAVEALPQPGSGQGPQPFLGYHFRILTAQGPAAPGGARDYVVNGELTGGFALIAWPAQYDVTGVMTFIVNDNGIVWERDLGADTAAVARTISTYDPNTSWTPTR